MTTDLHMEPAACPTATLLVELHDHLVQHDRVVLGDCPFGLDTQVLVEVTTPQGYECRPRVCGRSGEGRVVAGLELLAQVAVGFLHGADSSDAELVDQAPLNRAVGPLAPPSRLRRVGE